MKKLITTILATVFVMSMAAAGSYKLDDQKVDQLFENATEVELGVAMDDMSMTSLHQLQYAEGDITAGGAFIRAWFCGWIALHRSYMGTGDKNLFAIYFCTGGGCGLVTTVDWWVLLFKVLGDGDLSKFIDNPKFIMW